MRTSALFALVAVLGLPAAAAAAVDEAPLALKLTLLADSAPAAQPVPASAPAGDGLDFDLLGSPASAQPPVDDGALKLRRSMLSLHQGMGIGLLAMTTSSVVVGQLNYNDRFGGGPSTGRFELAHAGLAYGTLGLFAATGAMAMLAPVPLQKESEGVDRVTLHKVGLFTAAAGMAAQAGLGIAATAREGHVNQQGFATAHLAIGYLTLAGMALGVGALVF